ncbi:hypothetical protein NM208_g8273 [Fusarium decemcellulare]|uniref:Uncharacterized protein n=1 Tax=Fusarium decemcellulare TaxID=57161 RepID=A0ACC1S655_9HYPO|nr:hypothetical protein NM208_g8273 [Fusarium decemcellulare]
MAHPAAPGDPADLNGDGVINVFEAGAQAGKRSTEKRQSGSDIISQLQETFDRDNPNGTPVGPGNEDDLNGDGVINPFEAGAQVSKRSDEKRQSGSDIISQLQETFDRDNPNGTPAAPGDPADLNGDGVINVFEAGAQAG